MKHFFTLLMFACLGLSAQAQYYYLPFPNAGENPGGLNTDNEYPVGGGIPAGWTSIQATAAAPTWSSVQSIPFGFSFNAAAVTQYKVSTSGVLTFDVATAVAAPSETNTALPSAAIPDKSVMCWGISGTGTNDNIVTKTFGTAPNRQHWISFSSYEASGTTCYVYWSIVLEETSNKIYIVDLRNGQCTQTVTAGIQIDATTAVSVAGSPSLSNLSGTDPSPADNTYYEFTQGVQPANNAKMSALNIQEFVIAPTNVNVMGTITNLGSAAITTMDIKYKVNGTTYTDTKTGLNIAFGSNYNFTHNTPLTVSNPTTYPMDVWVELAGDSDNSNDSLNFTVKGLTFNPTKRVVFEEATGTWCGWCPRGAVYMDSLAGLHPNTAMTIAVHNGDPMVDATYDTGIGALIGGYPSGLVDRKDNDVDPSSFIDEYDARITDIAPCDVTVTTTFDAVSRLMTVDVSAMFATDLSGEYRFNAVIVEDDVTGTASGYNQTNYYSSSSQNIALVGAGHNWQTSPNPVPAASMVYDHVGRKILGDWDGTASSLPATIAANSTHHYSYTYTLPATWDETQIHAVGWVSSMATGHILNANRGTFAVGIEDEIHTSFEAKILGNPSPNGSFLKLSMTKPMNVKIDIIDALGKVVNNFDATDIQTGDFVIDLHTNVLSAGFYNVIIKAGEEQVTRKLIVVE